MLSSLTKNEVCFLNFSPLLLFHFFSFCCLCDCIIEYQDAKHHGKILLIRIIYLQFELECLEVQSY